jgi:hypothetical protein
VRCFLYSKENRRKEQFDNKRSKAENRKGVISDQRGRMGKIQGRKRHKYGTRHPALVVAQNKQTRGRRNLRSRSRGAAGREGSPPHSSPPPASQSLSSLAASPPPVLGGGDGAPPPRRHPPPLPSPRRPPPLAPRRRQGLRRRVHRLHQVSPPCHARPCRHLL